MLYQYGRGRFGGGPWAGAARAGRGPRARAPERRGGTVLAQGAAPVSSAYPRVIEW